MSKALDIIKSLKEEQDYMSMDDPSAAIKKDYKVGKDGVIHEPGKFEGESFWIVYYYDLVMNGFSDESGGDVEPLELIIWYVTSFFWNTRYETLIDSLEEPGLYS